MPISTTSTPKDRLALVATKLAEPRKNTTAVWIRVYREFIPSRQGVTMVLLMMDWNTREAPADGKRRDQHDDQLGGADLHGIGKQLGIGEIHPPPACSPRRREEQWRPGPGVCAVGADGQQNSQIRTSFQIGMASSSWCRRCPDGWPAAIFEPVKEQTNEDQASQNAHDQLDGQFVGGR